MIDRANARFGGMRLCGQWKSWRVVTTWSAILMERARPRQLKKRNVCLRQARMTSLSTLSHQDMENCFRSVYA